MRSSNRCLVVVVLAGALLASPGGLSAFPQLFTTTYTLTDIVETDAEVHLTLSVNVSHDDPETVLDVRVRVERPGAPEDATDPDWTLAAFDAHDVHAGATSTLTRRLILQHDEYATWTEGAPPRFHLSFYAGGQFYQVLLDAVQTSAAEPSGQSTF